ncbi:hypothetical protein GQ457_09G022130 [Hibiscus cannabinus]
MSNTQASIEESVSPSLADSGNSNAAGASSQSNTTRVAAKRKTITPRSEVWSHFTKFVNSEGQSKGKCNYCDREFCCDGKKNGTGSLKYHMKQCKKSPTNVLGNNQCQLILPNKGLEGEVGQITTWKFDQEATRNALAQMIVIGEMSFKFVESEGFRKFMPVACPRFRIPSRLTVTRDIYQLYLDERAKLKQYLKSSCSRVCLTTDTWTSLQRVNYMCLTVHFIDNDWKLNKKIINFCPISSHKGDAIGMMIENCLLSWGIDKIFTVTVDNASSNDVAISYLRKKCSPRGFCIANGKYIHMRCMTHIVNLIVVEGLKEMNKSVARVRGLWNSTYLMLDTAQNFERAFERFEEQDTKFKAELELGEGWPTTNDWSSVRNLRDFLEHFYEVTLRVSGTSYVTSNNFFDELTEIDILLQDAQSNVDIDFSVMAMKMKDKYDKYWGDIDKMNMLIFVACVLDPRHKLNYLEFALSEMYNSGKSSEWGKTVFVNDPQQKVKKRMKDLFKRRVIENGGEDQTSELDKYLGEATENHDDGFDILLWWKVNSPRFPALSKMAKDVLAIPLSTVASESAFSTGGRVLDQFRSSLTPKMVQALVCTQDYIRNPSTEEEIKKIEEQIQELDKIDNDSSWNALDPTLNS